MNQRENLKWCPACKSYKDFSAFHANTSKPDGLQSECKICQAARKRTGHRILDTVDNLVGIMATVVRAVTAPIRWIDRLIPKRSL